MVLQVQNLCKEYPQFSLRDISFQLPEGAIMGLIGENGAGKSTTMRMILGMAQPDSGQISVFGHRGVTPQDRESIGVVFDEMPFNQTLYTSHLGRVMKKIYSQWDESAYNQYLQRFSLPDKKEIKDFSRGMKMKLSLAIALSHGAQLLILDEPTNGLDPIGIAEVRSFIRELCDARGKTILISSHILSEISLLADDIGIIDHGALLEEESLAELEQKSSKHIRFTLSDTAQAARILERNFHENHFSIQDDHNLRLHNLDLPVGKIVTAFVENGLEVSEAHTCEESLEDYFKRVTGGEGIA